MSDKKIKVVLVKSPNGALDKQKKTLQALGLRKIGNSAVHNDNDAIRGMVFVVKHLVKVEEM